MITLEQLDELENRIIKALELIGDLRTENSRLELENQKLRDEYENIKNVLDQKERDINQLKEQLNKTSAELKDLKEKESILEKRISEILSKLTEAEGKNYDSGASKKFESSKKDETLNTIPITNDELTIVEEDMSSSKEESTVQIELEKPIEKPDFLKNQQEIQVTGTDKIETEEHGFVKQASMMDSMDSAGSEVEEDEIIVLDEDEDEIILAEEDDEHIVIEENESITDSKDVESDLKEVKTLESNNLQTQETKEQEKDILLDDEIILDDDDVGVFELEDDDDFLIIEENENNNTK